MSYDDFIRYLESKQSVDDRALNLRVWRSMVSFLEGKSTALKILEVGVGHGAMVERLARTGILANAAYVALDSDEANIAAARSRFVEDRRIGSLELLTRDLFETAETFAESFDLVIAHAVFDLLDMDRALPLLQRACRPGGAFYFTINFDGETIFEPVDDPELEGRILGRYHATMDERRIGGRRSGHSESGRRLLVALLSMNANVIAAGGSDWVVWPQDGAYGAEEAYFLHFIVDTVVRALAGDATVTEDELDRWSESRHQQIDRGELVYIAHQLDFFGYWRSS